MKLINFFLFFIFISINLSFADINKEFENWKLNFKKTALENNISEKTFDIVTVSYTHLTLPTILLV